MVLKNICERFYSHLEQTPNQLALVDRDRGLTLSYAELGIWVETYRNKFKKLLPDGSQVLFLAPIESKTIAMLLALFANGYHIVVIDPAMPRDLFRQAMAQMSPDAILSLNSFFKLKWIWWRIFRSINIDINHSDWSPPGTACPIGTPLPLVEVEDQKVILSSYSRGTTGRPKLIERTHQTLCHQQSLSIKYLPKLDVDVHLVGYGLSILQSLIQGATTFICPDNVTDALALLDSGSITRLSGPPGFMIDLATKMISEKKYNKSIKSFLFGGAPISKFYVKKVNEAFPNAQGLITYGATEVEPLSFINSEDYCRDLQSFGYPLGPLIKELTPAWRGFKTGGCFPAAFELTVSGLSVARAESIHNTGDLFETSNHLRLNYLGRTNEMLWARESELIPAGVVEEFIETQQLADRAALFGIHQTSFLYCVNPKNEKRIKELLQSIFHLNVKLVAVESIPLDARHKWKIQKRQIIEPITRRSPNRPHNSSIK